MFGMEVGLVTDCVKVTIDVGIQDGSHPHDMGGIVKIF